MDTSIIQNEYVFTKKANCVDCYRCLKACPVKAIKVKKGQAYILQEHCIDCNICAMNCAQKAISYKNDKSKFYELLKSGKKLVASVAPSYASICATWERARFPSALRKLGFSFASGASVGANIVVQEMMKFIKAQPEKSFISSICPTVVNYVEKYHSNLIDNLIPVVSPYIAHAKWLRHKLGNDIVVVHINACLPQKMEILRPEFLGVVDLVLSFAELRELFDENKISLKTCEESGYDEVPVNNARLFQFVGGLSAISGEYDELLATNVLPISGFQDIKNSLEVASSQKGLLIEPLFCYRGCINGPGIHIKSNIFDKRKEVIDYIKSRRAKSIEVDPLIGVVDVSRTFDYTKQVKTAKITEEEINKILNITGNSDAEVRPNCFSCGYFSCHEHAVAVHNGMAEIEMCTPHMRRSAEGKAAQIIDTSPYGIVTLNENFEITSMNKAFRNFFMTTDSMLNKQISYIMDPEPFYKLNTEKLDKIELTINHEKYSIICFEIIYKLDSADSYVGMFLDITKSINDKTKLDELRQKTLEQAQQLRKHQMEMAAGIANLLGKNTAQSEVLLENLIKFTQGDQFVHDGINTGEYF